MKATVRMKLTLGFVGLLSVGAASSVAVLAIVSRSLDEVKHVVTVSDVIEHRALEMRFSMLEMSDAMRGFLINPQNTAEAARKKRADADFERAAGDIVTLAPGGDILALVNEAADLDRNVLNKVEDELLAHIAAGQIERAKARYTTEYLPVRLEQERLIANMENETIRLRYAALVSAERSYRVARTTTWILVVTVAGLGLVVSFFLARSLAKPIVRMAASMTSAARGDLGDVLEFDDRTDEIGELSRSINATYVYLQDMARVAHGLAGGDLTVQVTPRSEKDGFGAAFLAMVEKLSLVIGDVRSGASALSGASIQVSASSQTLSQGTSEQAASVEETTASLEQMSASITRNAENSRQTEQMAVKGAARGRGRVARRRGHDRRHARDRPEDLGRRGHRVPDEPPGPERRDRGGARRRARARLRGGGARGAQARREQPVGGQGDRRARRTSVAVAESVRPAARARSCPRSARRRSSCRRWRPPPRSRRRAWRRSTGRWRKWTR